MSYAIKQVEVMAHINRALGKVHPFETPLVVFGQEQHFFIDTRDLMACESGRRIMSGQPFDGTIEDVYAVIGERWTWARNVRCKYLLIGVVHGRLHVSDREGKPLTLAELKRQYDGDEGPA